MEAADLREAQGPAIGSGALALRPCGRPPRKHPECLLLSMRCRSCASRVARAPSCAFCLSGPPETCTPVAVYRTRFQGPASRVKARNSESTGCCVASRLSQNSNHSANVYPTTGLCSIRDTILGTHAARYGRRKDLQKERCREGSVHGDHLPIRVLKQPPQAHIKRDGRGLGTPTLGGALIAILLRMYAMRKQASLAYCPFWCSSRAQSFAHCPINASMHRVHTKILSPRQHALLDCLVNECSETRQ
jgi:hypothetical protein